MQKMCIRVIIFSFFFFLGFLSSPEFRGINTTGLQPQSARSQCTLSGLKCYVIRCKKDEVNTSMELIPAP